MCLLIRTLYKFNTLEAFSRAVEIVEQYWTDKYIRGRVVYSGSKMYLKWKNLRQQLEKAETVNPSTIHGLIVVENQ